MIDQEPSREQRVQWAKVIDHTRCIGCHACTTACKSENVVPIGVTRTYVKHVDVGIFPQVRRAHQSPRCNQCAHAPCVTACPTAAMFKRADGIVDFDKSICIGCKACMAACPYDAIFINPEDHSAEKCNFCAHRIDVGLEPACVVVCPVEAILVGDMNDPDSKVARIASREPVAVRRPEKETLPKLFYKGAHLATLDPLAARRPDGDLFMWSEQKRDAETVNSGSPDFNNTSAAALLSYDVPHSLPWDWRVSLYTWTKGIAAGAYLVAVLLLILLQLQVGPSHFYVSEDASPVFASSPLWLWVAPVLSGFFLDVTGGLLIWDLEHPARFYMIFTRPHWRSWLVKGAFIIAGYSLVLALHFIGSIAGSTALQSWLMIAGIPLSILTAVYTSYLFSQAKARDLWQNPLLPPHLFIQSMLLGSAVLLPLTLVSFDSSPADIFNNAFPAALWILTGASLIHLLLILGELSLTHATAHARVATWEMMRGRYRTWFWTGIALAIAGGALPLAAFFGYLSIGMVGVLLAIAGVVFYEHAYVQAGQSVPLA